jgi:hypothetical protein
MSRYWKLLMLMGLLVFTTLPMTGMAGPRKPPSAAPKVSLPAPSKTATPKLQVPPSSVRSLSTEMLEELATTRYLDPTTARQLHEKGMAEAMREFPHLFGKSTQEHHVVPKYLGGLPSGKAVTLDKAYHQLITNAFRREFSYNQAAPDLPRLKAILRVVYSKYPLPGIHF